jgi:hypothetical protein
VFLNAELQSFYPYTQASGDSAVRTAAHGAIALAGTRGAVVDEPAIEVSRNDFQDGEEALWRGGVPSSRWSA